MMTNIKTFYQKATVTKINPRTRFKMGSGTFQPLEKYLEIISLIVLVSPSTVHFADKTSVSSQARRRGDARSEELLC